eukprot:2430025-Amphidinium_carterae.3
MWQHTLLAPRAGCISVLLSNFYFCDAGVWSYLDVCGDVPMVQELIEDHTSRQKLKNSTPEQHKTHERDHSHDVNITWRIEFESLSARLPKKIMRVARGDNAVL